jgi:tetratricopeptide (TPR) repeat protein
MKKYSLFILAGTVILVGSYAVSNLGVNQCPITRSLTLTARVPALIIEEKGPDINQGLALLKSRKDNQALAIFDNILTVEPSHINALWGKAEVLRRTRKFSEAEEILKEVLNKNPGHAASLLSLAYIRYHDDLLDKSLALVNQALSVSGIDKENAALAYLLLGAINSSRSSKGALLSKVIYGTHIKGYFLKAEAIAPELPEVHLGLGAFYLLAPAIAGGNLDKAIEELELAFKIAPDFATVNARLAQAYKEKGDLGKYNFYINRVKTLDPDNEVLQELQ